MHNKKNNENLPAREVLFHNALYIMACAVLTYQQVFKDYRKQNKKSRPYEEVEDIIGNRLIQARLNINLEESVKADSSSYHVDG